jgi:hypothetical protein
LLSEREKEGRKIISLSLYLRQYQDAGKWARPLFSPPNLFSVVRDCTAVHRHAPPCTAVHRRSARLKKMAKKVGVRVNTRIFQNHAILIITFDLKQCIDRHQLTIIYC